VFSLNLNDFVLVWMSLLYEAIPFVALGSIVSGLVETFVSRETVVRWMPRHRGVGILVSAFLGIAFPMCECGIVPVVRRLVLKGVPASCAITYMLAAPIVHPLVLLSTFIAFQAQGGAGMVVLRFGLGVVVATGVGMVIWQFMGDRGVFRDEIHEMVDSGHVHVHVPAGASFGRKILVALRISADDFATFGAFLIVGTAIAAVINSGFSRAAIAPIAERPALSVAGFMVLAVLLNVCSEADAFIAASFQAFSVPAKLSFLVLGPMLDLKLLMMFAPVFRKRAIALLCALMVSFVFALCVTGSKWMPEFIGMLPE